jgi:uncharacterized protein (TIGR02996 family)
MHSQPTSDDRGAALLAAVLERPDDDAPRLALADHLEDAGDADRARFIRVSCRLARLPWGAPDRGEVERETVALLGEHHEAWGAGVHPWAAATGWCRGFLTAVRALWEVYRVSAPAILRAAPLLEHVCLIGFEPGVGDLTKVCATWRCAGAAGPAEPDEVPGELWPLMTGRQADGGLMRIYRDEEGNAAVCRILALKDLSQACVAYGRRAAGLFRDMSRHGCDRTER